MGKEWCLILLLALEAMLPCSEGYALHATKNLECKAMCAQCPKGLSKSALGCTLWGSKVHWVAHSGEAGACWAVHSRRARVR